MTAIRNAVLALSCVIFLSGCTAAMNSPANTDMNIGGAEEREAFDAPECSSLFTIVMARERQGDTSGALGAEVDALGDRCPIEYWRYVDYHSIKMFALRGDTNACGDGQNLRIDPVAIEMARRDGFCTDRDAGAGADPDFETEEPEELATADPVRLWECRYEPTYNNDWHDDVVCSNGSERHRPYLRDWDDFITQDEIMQSAREYEEQLNGR